MAAHPPATAVVLTLSKIALTKINFSRYSITALSLASLLLTQLSSGQQAIPPQKKFELTVDSIMRGLRLVGYPPAGVYWSQDSQKVYFRWKQSDEPRLKEMSLYVVNRDGSGLRRLSEDEARLAPPANGELSKLTEEAPQFILQTDSKAHF